MKIWEKNCENGCFFTMGFRHRRKERRTVAKPVEFVL